MMAKCQSPFTHIGSKWNLASMLVETVMQADADAYVEPFAGSLAVLLNKPRHQTECVNDLDEDIVNFFTVLRDEPEELIRLCELTPHARVEFDDCKALLEIIESPVERARCWWACKTLSINGKMQTFRSSPKVAVTDFPSRFAAISRRLQGVIIESIDALELIRRYDDPRTVFYLDPPYLGSTRSGGAYNVEMTRADHHEEFLRIITSCKGTVVLSGYPSELYDRVLCDTHGWTRAEVEVMSTLHVQGKSGAPRTEVIWANDYILGAFEEKQPSLFDGFTLGNTDISGLLEDN